MKFLGWMSEPYPHDYEEFEKAAEKVVPPANESLRNLPPRKKLHYSTGEEIQVGDKVQSVTGLYGTVNNFSWHDGENEPTVLVNVEKGGGSSHMRPNVPFFVDRLQLKSKAEPAAEPEEINEGLKTEIKTRTKSQQYREAIKFANKKLKEVNTVLEYAQELKTNINESTQTNLLESMKKSMASAYKKMKNLQ
jgi:hypothetical protein